MNSATARQTATALGVCERTVRRWIKSGVLPAEKVGGMFLIDPEDAQAAFAQSRAAHNGEQAEWRGRYLEVKKRLEQVTAELEEERDRRLRFEAVLYPSAQLERERRHNGEAVSPTEGLES